MVLESILNPRNAEDKPWHVFVIALFYTMIAVFFADKMFPAQASMLSIAFITIIFVPFFQKLFELEEEKEEAPKSGMISRHKRSIFVFSAFFLGVMFAITYIYMFFPSLTHAFRLQTETLSGFSGAASSDGDFMRFFLNNTQVMALMFILSVMFGGGAIFILAWNASVIAVYLGTIASGLAAKLGFAAYLYGVPVGIGGIVLHGVPEIAAYFVAGLAGGILSVGIIREKISSPAFMRVLKDSLIFLAAAEVLIVFAAAIEAFV